MQTRTVVFVALAALIVWRLYRRTHRLAGRQRLTPARPWASVCLYPVLIVLLAAGAWRHPAAAAALAAGTVIGVALGAYALRVTQFEHTAAGLFYRPSAHIGIALALLLVFRVVYRFSRLDSPNGAAGFPAGAGAAVPPSAFVSSPITLAIFGTLAGYYLAYAIGLLLWRARVRRTAAQAAAAQNLTK